MIEVSLRKIGNQFAVVLPEEAIARLKITEGASLYLVEVPDGGYRLVPCDAALPTKATKAEDIVTCYRDALTKLSK